MPRIDWPDGAARLFIVTEITYTPDVRTGAWRTQLTAEQWTAGPDTWGAGGGADLETDTSPAVVMFNLVVEGPLDIGVDPNETVDSVPPSAVSRIEWWWGDGTEELHDGDWTVGSIPGNVHHYDAPGQYVVGLRLTLNGTPSGVAEETVELPG